jgi:hypothetical protein
MMHGEQIIKVFEGLNWKCGSNECGYLEVEKEKVRKIQALVPPADSSFTVYHFGESEN